METTITRERIREWLEARRPFVLAEALGEAYYAAGHLPGAIPMPLDKLDQVAESRIPDPTTAVVVYCSGPTCGNSKAAARRLAQLGYENVFVFEGGKQDWRDADLPIVTGAEGEAARRAS